MASIGQGPHALISAHVDPAFRAILRGEGVTTSPRVITLVTGEAHPFGNFACVTEPADHASIDEAVRTLEGCGGPSAVLCAGDTPEASAARLAAAGYVFGMFWSVAGYGLAKAMRRQRGGSDGSRRG